MHVCKDTTLFAARIRVFILFGKAGKVYRWFHIITNNFDGLGFCCCNGSHFCEGMDVIPAIEMIFASLCDKGMPFFIVGSKVFYRNVQC